MTWTTMSADEPLVALRGSAGRFYCVFRAVVLPPAAVHTNHGTHPAAVSSWRNVLPSNQIPKVRGRSIKAEHGLDALLYIHHTILLHLWAFSVARTMSGLSRSKLATPSVSPPSKAPKPWVDPHTMPDYGDISEVAGNAPDVVKRLTNNTFASYGVGDEGSFAYTVGRAVKFVEVKVDRKEGRGGRLEATTVCEVAVCKGASCLVSFVLCCSRPPARRPTRFPDMLNGAGMMHGGCIAYLIDKCARLLRARSPRLTSTYSLSMTAVPARPSSCWASWRT